MVDTSTGTGGGSCGEGADKSSPSTSGGAGAATTATASPRSLAATTASAITSPSHSPGFVDPEAIISDKSDEVEEFPSASPTASDDVNEPRKSYYETGPASEDAVVLRRQPSNGYRKVILQRNSYSTNEAGRLLKLCLEKHFNQSEVDFKQNDVVSSESSVLDSYIEEVFRQLDYHRCGTVSRDDFDTLCEVLDLPPSRPPSSNGAPFNYRLSGLEWLSSYRPRSPMSPLRADKLSDVKYRGPKRSPTSPPPNFLFTLGPRPFWEMWPQKKRRKRRLTLEEFQRALMEQWAKNHDIPSNRVSLLLAGRPPTASTITSNGLHRNHRHIRSVRVQPIPTVSMDTVDNGHAAGVRQHTHNGHATLTTTSNYRGSSSRPRVHYETRAKRFFRRLTRVSRRVHFIRRLSRRIRRDQIGPPLQPRIAVNPASRPIEVVPSPVQLQERQNLPPPPVEKQRARVHLLERQVEHQQTEICGLRDVVEDLRSSLQLSDAQNLALQVLLKKMAKAEVQLPVIGHDSFRSQMDESEKHLENLVKELKEMSQTKYPSYLPHANLHGGSSTATSINGGIGALPDFILEDEVQETSKVLGEASDELKAATTELQTLAVTKLPQQENNHEQFESMNLKEAYKALERAQEELEKMRYCSNINNRG